ncbi:tail fiber assembly protein [Gilliamella sp. Occ4-3]|uniref:tail fiber assembly protein n=1 Tax=Gilliamella sp. Occ4-3 TaxID=3120254 RepID=UPI00080EB1E3|nr:tail fiber assembly protein [Gilliamella apicola]OCG79401.1 hypothetical protein A9G44_11760 [Gilliamella apicola]
MKYKLTPPFAKFDNNGFAVEPGWVLIYNSDPVTGEFINATYEYVANGFGFPVHACSDAPVESPENKAIVRKNGAWVYLDDHRGKKIYSTKNGEEATVKEIGDIPVDYTFLKPACDFDVWNGEEWVLDKEKQHNHYVMLASVQKNQLLSEAKSRIDYLQDAIDTDIATNEEKTAYSAWKKYRVLLNRIDVDAAPEIDWPEKPE